MTDLNFESIAEMVEYLHGISSAEFSNTLSPFLECQKCILSEENDDPNSAEQKYRLEFPDGSAIIRVFFLTQVRYSIGISRDKISSEYGNKEPMLFDEIRLISSEYL